MIQFSKLDSAADAEPVLYAMSGFENDLFDDEKLAPAWMQHARPRAQHAHFFGTSTLSFSDGFRTQPGDVFEIEMTAFGAPLRNELAVVETLRVAPRAL